MSSRSNKNISLCLTETRNCLSFSVITQRDVLYKKLHSFGLHPVATAMERASNF